MSSSSRSCRPHYKVVSVARDGDDRVPCVDRGGTDSRLVSSVVLRHKARIWVRRGGGGAPVQACDAGFAMAWSWQSGLSDTHGRMAGS